jgi:hypothetical protein
MGSKEPFHAFHANGATPALGELAYHGLAGEIVRIMEPHTEAHPAALLGTLLTMVGAAIGRGARMTVSGVRHHANLFICIVGDSSRARKTTAVQNMREVCKRAGILPEIVSGLSSGEGIIYAIRDSEMDDQGVDDKRLLIIESELGRGFGAIKRGLNSLSAVLREAWDGDPLRTLVKRHALTCLEPHVALIGAITQEELRKRLGETELWNGLGNRFLWIRVTRPHLLPDAVELPWRELEGPMRQIAEAIELAQNIGELHRSECARERWREIYCNLSATEHSGVRGVLTDRAEAHVLRIAMIFALLDSSSVIERCHLDAALTFWRFAEASVIEIFNGLGKDARTLDSILKMAAPSELSREEINRKASGHLYGNRLKSAGAELVRAGRATFRIEKTAGRPRALWKAT